MTIAFQLPTLFGQNLQTQLKESAVKLVYLDTLEIKIYDKLKDFNLLMLGEMHGTNEPANFLIGLAELFVHHGDTVQVGFEIPNELMTAYNHLLTDSSVFQSAFFSTRSTDGRASTAWANAIARLTQNSSIQIFFYDSHKTEHDDFQNRDSLMYLTIKKRILEHPKWRTITLSGNIHNMRLQFRGNPTTAYYLCNDKDLNLYDKLCTLNHSYLSGTMLNNIGNGLELRQVNNSPSIFSETLDFDNYLYLYPTPSTYNGMFFTKTVTASTPTSKE